MIITDVLRYTFTTLKGFRMRSALMLLAMAIGVAAVVVLTSLGEGAQRYVNAEFASLGTHLIVVLPGRSETSGGAPNMLVGSTPRDLTLDDALALTRNSSVQRVAPIAIGTSNISWQGREREVPILGSNSELLELRHWKMNKGRFLPNQKIDNATPVVVLGSKVRNELFGAQAAIGEWLRIGDRRFRVIGVMATEGRSIGIDVEEVVIIPAASAMSLFNNTSLYRILVEGKSREAIPRIQRFVINTLRERHQGEEDITVVTQDSVLATFDRIFQALTLTVAGIAAISLAVAGVLIMNVMLVSVAHRTAEIGLLKAVGASSRQVMVLFMTEAAMLSLLGSAIGLIIGWSSSLLINSLYPGFDAVTPLWAVVAAMGVSLSTGLLFGVMPARRAARLDPVQALSSR